MQGRAADVAPVLGAALRQRHRARQHHRLARKEAQVRGGLGPIGGLVEQPPIDADHAVAADHPLAGDAARLGGSELAGNLAGIGVERLDRGLVDVRLHRSIVDPGGIEHVPADRAGRSENQGQKNNLVEKPLDGTSADMGAGSIGGFCDTAAAPFDDSSPGMNFIPSL